MFHISIALTLLTLMGGTLLLSKVKTDAMGNFAKWVAYIVIVMSFIMLLFDLTHGVMRMMHCDDGYMRNDHHMMMKGDEHCGPGMRGGMMEHCGGQSMDCCEEEKGHGMMKGHGCEMEEEEEVEVSADSSKK